MNDLSEYILCTVSKQEKPFFAVTIDSVIFLVRKLASPTRSFVTMATINKPAALSGEVFAFSRS